MQCLHARTHAAFSSASFARPPCAAVSVRPVRLIQQQRELESVVADVRRLVILSAKKGGGKGGKSSDDESPKGKGGAAAGAVDVAKISKEIKTDAEDRMKKALEVLSGNFNTIRTGRANPAILDKISVTYFGSPTPLKQMGSISVPEATTLVITPFDRTALRDIEKAILESDIGINPNNDGERIRLVMPPMTQDRRKELVKSVKDFGEDSKVAVRNIRKDSMKKVDKVDFPKDDKKGLEDDVQKLTDLYCKKVDDAVKTKSDELMKV